VATKRLGHLCPTHPLAELAARRCAAHAGTLHRSYIGRVACGVCWERAIRDDERVAVLFGLPDEQRPDPAYVDEIAVEFACRGQRQPLTAAELAEAVRRLDAAGAGQGTIAARLGLSAEHVRDILAGLADAIALLPTAGPGPAAPPDDETAVA
jgi:hypothetical protein